MSDDSEMYQKALDASNVTTEITCARATSLCQFYKFDPMSFREYCDSKGIKFKKCLFGCFE